MAADDASASPEQSGRIAGFVSHSHAAAPEDLTVKSAICYSPAIGGGRLMLA